MKVMPENQRNKIIPIYIFVLQLAVVIGLFVSGWIHVQYTQIFLLLSGTISTLVGVYGAIVNFSYSGSLTIHIDKQIKNSN